MYAYYIIPRTRTYNELSIPIVHQVSIELVRKQIRDVHSGFGFPIRRTLHRHIQIMQVLSQLVHK